MIRPMTYSLHALSVSAGRLGLAVLLACSSVSAQSLTPSHPGLQGPGTDAAIHDA